MQIESTSRLCLAGTLSKLSRTLLASSDTPSAWIIRGEGKSWGTEHNERKGGSSKPQAKLQFWSSTNRCSPWRRASSSRQEAWPLAASGTWRGPSPGPNPELTAQLASLPYLGVSQIEPERWGLKRNMVGMRGGRYWPLPGDGRCWASRTESVGTNLTAPREWWWSDLSSERRDAHFKNNTYSVRLPSPAFPSLTLLIDRLCAPLVQVPTGGGILPARRLVSRTPHAFLLPPGEAYALQESLMFLAKPGNARWTYGCNCTIWVNIPKVEKKKSAQRKVISMKIKFSSGRFNDSS